MDSGFARAWTYAIKTYGAAMLALGVGFAANLDRPYWAMATVFIASQPHAGTTRSKALYRLLGTLLGASAAVALVPNLVNAPELLVAALAGWVALMLTLALLDRTPRGYVFMLASYTAAIIGFPSVDSPDAIFTTAVARAEEISLGVLCATLVSSLVFPRNVIPMIIDRMGRWVRDGRRWTEDVLAQNTPSPDVEADRRRMAADIIDIGVMASQVPFDVGGRTLTPGVQALHARLLMLLPLLSSIASRLSALRADDASNPTLQALLAETARYVSAESESEGFEPLERQLARTQMAAIGADWRQIMEATLLLRLRELITLVRDCRALQRHIEGRRAGLPPLVGGIEIEAAALQHVDVPMAIFSGLSAGLAVAFLCAFWIASAWPEGAIAAEMCAVACCFFAAQDDPAPAILRFLRWTVVAILVDAAYLFAVLPAIDGFVMLAATLAPTYIVYGLLTARPKTQPVGMALAANGATLLALQSTYAADFATFVNSGIAATLGMAAAAIMTKLIRSVGSSWSAWRLVRSNWISLAEAALRRGRGDRVAFAGLMMDRIGLVASRLDAIESEQAPSLSKLQADLRIGLNIVDLRRARRQLPPEATQAIDWTLDGLAAHYLALSRGSLAKPKRGPDAGLLERIDRAIAEVSAHSAGAGGQDALQGLVGVRLGLFPDAPSFQSGGGEPPPPKQAAA